MRFCANISWLFREVPFLERPEAARRAGFSGIEFHSAEGHHAADVARAAKEAGVSVVLINASMGDFLGGGSGWSGVPGREAEFRGAIEQAGAFGAALGGVSVQIGQSRVPAGVTREECMRVYVENLRHAASELARGGSRPLVEPMNETDFPGVLVNDVETGLDAIARAGNARIGLQFDAYHCHMSGSDVCGTVEAHARRFAHVQFSDAPGRQEPGTGVIDIAGVFRALEQAGYRHWVAAEYRPSRATGQTLGWMTRRG